MTDKNRQKKEAEGDQKMKEADKMASSGFFKKPDWIGAAMEYEKAAVIYRNVKCYEKAMKAYQKAAEAHTKSSLPSSAAKFLLGS
jgi:hypothetical protein